jgi:hypothetical protein
MGSDKRNGMTRLQFMRAWIKRLRDPKSKQCFGPHRIGNAYCAGGHGCVVAGFKWRKIGNGVYEPVSGQPGFRLWLCITRKESQAIAHTLNDVRRWSLPKIADHIETKLLPKLRKRWAKASS